MVAQSESLLVEYLPTQGLRVHFDSFERVRTYAWKKSLLPVVEHFGKAHCSSTTTTTRKIYKAVGTILHSLELVWVQRLQRETGSTYSKSLWHHNQTISAWSILGSVLRTRVQQSEL